MGCHRAKDKLRVYRRSRATGKGREAGPTKKMPVAGNRNSEMQTWIMIRSMGWGGMEGSQRGESKVKKKRKGWEFKRAAVRISHRKM